MKIPFVEILIAKKNKQFLKNKPTNQLAFMRNWDVFIIVSTFIIALALFSSGKIGFENMLTDLKPAETFLVMAKTVAVAIIGTVSLAIMVLLVIIDIAITLFSGVEFPVLRFFHDVVYMHYFFVFYWEAHSGSHIFLACIILFGVGIINTYLGPVHRKKTFVYHKTKETNYINHSN